MTISYQNSSLETAYLQIFLRDYFGYSISRQRVAVPAESEAPTYGDEEYTYVLNNDPIKVTGYFNLQTYSALALYMAYNYPMEGFPLIWTRDGNSWSSEDFISSQAFYGQSNIDCSCLLNPKSTTASHLSDLYSEVSDYIKFNMEGEDGYAEFIQRIIVANLKASSVNRKIIEVPERVLAYIFNEVVSSLSEGPEILRIKKLIYSNSGVKITNAKYDRSLVTKVFEYQRDFIADYTYRSEEEMSESIHLPLQFKDFKVTGYVDPWTELIIKKGQFYD